MVVSIHGLAGSEADRTFWEFFSGADALQEGGQRPGGVLSNGAVPGRSPAAWPHDRALPAGVGTYKPQDGEHIRAVFSTY